MTQQFALVLIACLTITSCTSTKGATEAEFSFTFQSDAEGWIAGFADLPANFEPSIYELDSGYRPLPQGLEGNGLYIQGHNRSDDLFMFFKRRIDGLKADATYAVFASLDLATNVPSNTFGIGGSPGESVYVKAGVSTVEPVAEGENLRLNIDKGNQSNDGASMVVIGNVAHPEVVGREFRLKSLDNADNPVNVTTDSKGGLKGYEASLEVGKVYRIIPDDEASVHGYIRIIDESGEDYAFGDHRFHRVDLPDAVGEILASAQQE